MIAIFDSGLGGLTVLKACKKRLPQYEYLYLGDTQRVPYGGRSQETIQKYAEEAVEFCFQQGVPLVIFACNTATAFALRHVQEKYLRSPSGSGPTPIKDKKILGVIRPVVEIAVKKTKNKRIAVVGTRATVASQAYEREIRKRNPEIKVFSKDCPLLVPLIEEGFAHKPEMRSILKKYLAPVKDFAPDTLILGCTHYPLIQDVFQDIMGKKVHIFDSATATAESLADYLIRHPEIESLLAKTGIVQYGVTDAPERFEKSAKAFLQDGNIRAEKVKL